MSATGEPRRCVIIGGGIAGLAAALRLAAVAPHLDISVIERSPEFGGKIVTERHDGFVIETGPDSFLASKPHAIRLARELGIGDQLVGTIPANRRTYVMHNGELHDLPEGLTGLVPTQLAPIAKSRLLSPVGKLRLALDYLLPSSKEEQDESLAHFVQRRLGREAYDRLVEPLMAGIYAGDGYELSLAATFPQLRAGEREHGGLIRGVLAQRKKAQPVDPTLPKSAFLSPEGGLIELVHAATARLRSLGVNLDPGRVVTRLDRTPAGTWEVTIDEGECLLADAVIIATPAGPSADLLERTVPAAAAALRAIPHVSTATVALAYSLQDVPRPLNGYGYVIPRIENRPALACTWVSSKWPNRAPAAYALIRVFVGRAGQQEVLERSDDELVRIAREELRHTLGIGIPPSMKIVTRWIDGMPQYTLGHLDRVVAIETAVHAQAGLAVAGHPYRGVGIPDCIASGERAADLMAAHLGSAT